MTAPRSAMREPMVWLLIGLPTFAVVASVMLLFTAVKHGDQELISEAELMRGAKSAVPVAPDAASDERVLSLRIEAGELRVERVSGAFDPLTPLRLQLRAADGSAGQATASLTGNGQAWTGSLAVGDDHDWDVSIQDTSGSWRLTGVLHRAEHTVQLKAATSAP